MTESPPRTATLLAALPLFNSLNDEEIARLAAATRALSVSRGEILFHRGEACHGFHVVVGGQIKLAFISAQGNEKVVEIIRPGQSFGEAVMFMDKPYPVYAQALCDTQLLHIARSALDDELARDPRLARRMLAGMAMRLHQMIADVESYSLQSGQQRIIGYLLRELPEIAGASGTAEIRLTTSKGVVASRLNLTQEHFSRILHELGEQGLIVVDKRLIRIPDIDRLRRHGS